MGQGAESCGGYEVDYDPYDDGLISGFWTQRDGSTIKIENMTDSHIKKAITVCNRAAMLASFSCDKDMWLDWVSVFENELWDRKESKKGNKKSSEVPQTKSSAKKQEHKKFSRGVSVIMVCHCGQEYSARQADLNRGWGLSCSKRCAAIRREFGRPAAKKKEGF